MKLRRMLAGWRRSAGLVVVPLVLGLSACQSASPMRDSLHWYRNSAEVRAAYQQAFITAARELRVLARDLPRGSWGVIMDVDETLLDNSDYATEVAAYEETSWNLWTARQAARALPGAGTFTDVVRNELGGRVALVTNRVQAACADTEANLRKVGIGYDRILCMTDTSNKNPRFAAVQAGSPESGSPPLQILMWLGDNIGDFPQLSQNSGDLSAFGTRYFVLPNPVYGSWEALPRR
jgi:5'-nucleotidase (lipoprotein e(P4) family)